MAYNRFQHKHQFKFRASSHTYFYDHTCTQDAPLPKNHTHAYSKHFATQTTHMHFFVKPIHMHTWSIFATQRSYRRTSLLNLYTCIFKESLLPKKITFHAYSSIFAIQITFQFNKVVGEASFCYLYATYIYLVRYFATYSTSICTWWTTFSNI